MVNRINGDVVEVDFLLLGLTCGLEFAVNGNIGVLVEAGITLETGFGLGSAYANGEVMLEETEFPFQAGTRGIVLEGVG